VEVVVVKLEEDCAGLHTTVNTLNQEKAQVTTDHQAEIVSEQKIFRDYHIGHRKRLRELHVNLENVVNEIGMRCLPYPGKSSTIGEIIVWFDKVIRVLLNTIMKVNKNLLVYCLVGVLKMLHENAGCRHLDGLNALMCSCDASFLDKIPNDRAKLAACIVKRWWTSHGLPYVTDAFHV
jgi:hypothetical protein